MNLVFKPRSELSDKVLLNEKVINLFISFLMYSFVGWVTETIYMSIYHGHLVKRGFLIGPLCVVYGIASLLVIYSLNNIKSHPFLLFLSASVLTSLVELAAGLVLSNLVEKRLWDYSGNLGNFMGYICLRNTILWGVMSLFLVYVIHPTVLKIIAAVSAKVKELFCVCVFIFLFLDIGISIYAGLRGINNITLISQVFMGRMP